MSKVEELLATANDNDQIKLIQEAMDEVALTSRRDLTARAKTAEDRLDAYKEASQAIMEALVTAIANGRNY